MSSNIQPGLLIFKQVSYKGLTNICHYQIDKIGDKVKTFRNTKISKCYTLFLLNKNPRL